MVALVSIKKGGVYIFYSLELSQKANDHITKRGGKVTL